VANEVPPTDRRHLGVRAEVHEVSGAPNDLAWRSMKGGAGAQWSDWSGGDDLRCGFDGVTGCVTNDATTY
jgi:hypothetical protein